MSEVNGQEFDANSERERLNNLGFPDTIINELIEYYQNGIIKNTDLDERALDALKELPVEAASEVLNQFKESDLSHVGNKSAFICGIIKTYRQKNKAAGGDAGSKAGPDEAKLKEILERTGYSLDVTTGQRKYGGPPPEWDGPTPGAGHEVFCGKIPRDVFEDQLILLFEKCGRIWDLRLMVDPATGFSRGYCFITYCEKHDAQNAVQEYDGFEIKPGKRLKVNISVANVRLFVGNIPKNRDKEAIQQEFSHITDGLVDVIIYASPDDPKRKNRGFAFLEYDSHKNASAAKRRLGSGRIKIWGCDIIVDWADPQDEPDEETMAKVKVLYVRNLKADVSEDMLKEKFEPYGAIERVKKVKDYGFVHFVERDDAMNAMKDLDGQKLGESEMQISLAKPPFSL